MSKYHPQPIGPVLVLTIEPGHADSTKERRGEQSGGSQCHDHFSGYCRRENQSADAKQNDRGGPSNGVIRVGVKLQAAEQASECKPPRRPMPDRRAQANDCAEEERKAHIGIWIASGLHGVDCSTVKTVTKEVVDIDRNRAGGKSYRENEQSQRPADYCAGSGLPENPNEQKCGD